MNELASNNIHIRAYSSDGYEITLLVTGTLTDVSHKLNEVRAAGFLAFQPAPVESERQTIASVMRHVTDSGTIVIAAYPAWKYEGKYGEYKFASIYLDSDDDTAQFEAQSGLKLADIPQMDGEAGVRRKYGKVLPKETAVKRTFDMIRMPDGVSDDGKPRYRYDYVARLPIVKRWSPADFAAFVARWKQDNLTEADLCKALKITRGSEWTGTVDEANAAVTVYIKAAMDSKPAQPKATTATPTRLIDCPTHLLETGDVIIQTYKTAGSGPATVKLEVLEQWGKMGNGYKLKLKNLDTEKEERVHWAGALQTLCDGPKVQAFAADPDACVAPRGSGHPVWNRQIAAPV